MNKLKPKASAKKLTFPKRVPEPKEMGEEEMKAFEKMSSDNYQRWMIPLVDDALSMRISYYFRTENIFFCKFYFRIINSFRIPISG